MGKQKQDKLIWWMCEQAKPLTASEMVEKSGIYTGNARYDNCLSDLKQLEKRDLAERSEGRPARWSPSWQAEEKYEDRNRFLVIGTFKGSGQRYANDFDAISAEHAEEQAKDIAEMNGHELVVAGTVEFEAGTLDDMTVH